MIPAEIVEVDDDSEDGDTLSDEHNDDIVVKVSEPRSRPVDNIVDQPTTRRACCSHTGCNQLVTMIGVDCLLCQSRFVSHLLVICMNSL
jgi:hypothetical protein